MIGKETRMNRTMVYHAVPIKYVTIKKKDRALSGCFLPRVTSRMAAANSVMRKMVPKTKLTADGCMITAAMMKEMR